ncbi:ricin-type beta-trefoil lectin domain protein [Catenuloplanes niger JCM 9533]
MTLPLATAVVTLPLTAAAHPLTALPLTAVAHPASRVPELRHDDPAIEWRQIVADGDDVERRPDGTAFNTFGGFGAVSCNNTSKLLLDYKAKHPDAYWRIMRLLFDPDDGAGLGHIKVELGADSNSSSGAEPATKRSADEPANVLRGAGFHMIADALRINPDVEVEALRWGEPSWTGNDRAKRYRWYKETIDAAYDTFGVEFDWMSPAQNEVRHAAYQESELDWTVQFAKWLARDAAAPDARYDYRKIKIVALDSYRDGNTVAGRILADPEALAHVDALGFHYDIVGGPNVTRLNKEYGMPILYSEGVAPMIDPQYRLAADPARGGIGGTVGAVDIADRFINAYRWSGAGADPAHMTTFLFQPAVSAMYEGTQYSPKHLIRASDPWSGYWEGDVGLVAVRHFHQFIGKGWTYVEGATGGDGTKGDGGTTVDSSTRTVLTARSDTQWTQVHANNTGTDRYFEVRAADLGPRGRSLHAWLTRGPDAGQPHDARYFQHIGRYAPASDGEHDVYRVRVPAYSILTLSTLPHGVHGRTAQYRPGDFAPRARDEILPLPYRDGFARPGTPLYTADQDGAFEVTDGVLQQQIHAHNRGYVWNVWGDGRQDVPSTAAPSTVLGDHRWADYTATVDIRLDPVDRDPALPNVAGLGVRQVYARGGDQATYAARLYEDGRWELRRLDAVVASGTVAGWDATAWHRLSVTARGTEIGVTLDGARLTSWTDTSGAPVLAGRIALVSGYYNTRFDNLAVTPVRGGEWASEKIDDADPRVRYPGGFTFVQAGFAHLNRTQHVLAPGRSMALDLTGTGFHLFGATGAATLEVRVDGEPPRIAQAGPAGPRQASYWLRDLRKGPHRVTVTVLSGTLTLDGVDVLGGR